MHMSETTSQQSKITMLTDIDASELCDCIHPAAVMQARQVLGDAPPAGEMALLFGILGDPTRIRVLMALSSGELCVNDLATAIGMNRTTISHQLRVLRQHRLVRRRRDGKVAYYQLDDDHVSALLRMAIDHAAEHADSEEETA
jgi:DNA-binding transcriptional ArsR family regulator